MLTAPDDRETLKSFYRTVRPWGFWRPIHDLVAAEDPDFVKNADFKRDMFNVVVGTIAQTALVALPIFVVIKEGLSSAVTLTVVVVCGVILKKTWYDRLET